MTKDLATAKSGLDKRRSTRVVQAMPIKVHGTDALSEPFTERTTTVMVSCHGCKYQSKHYVPKGSIVTVEIPRRNPNIPARVITGIVIWVQRPGSALDLLHIGLEFEVSGNVWDIVSAHDDWFPLPGEQPFNEGDIPELEVTPVVDPATSSTLTASWDASEILVMAGGGEEDEGKGKRGLAPAMQQTESFAQRTEPTLADAAIETLSTTRPKAGPGLHAAIEQTVRECFERLSESIVQDARKAYQTTAKELDAKIQNAVAEAVRGLPAKRTRRNKIKP